MGYDPLHAIAVGQSHTLDRRGAQDNDLNDIWLLDESQEAVVEMREDDGEHGVQSSEQARANGRAGGDVREIEIPGGARVFRRRCTPQTSGPQHGEVQRQGQAAGAYDRPW